MVLICGVHVFSSNKRRAALADGEGTLLVGVSSFAVSKDATSGETDEKSETNNVALYNTVGILSMLINSLFLSR